jgi:hypothetical protein
MGDKIPIRYDYCDCIGLYGKYFQLGVSFSVSAAAIAQVPLKTAKIPIFAIETKTLPTE